MTRTESRYDVIAQVWSTVTVPPLTRTEAERAARRIYRHFGPVRLGGPHMTRAVRFNGRVRRCWITRKTNAGLSKGWQRLVHDVSHRIFAQRHPHFRPHAGGHARLEHEIASYVIAKGWLSGTLRSKRRAGSLLLSDVLGRHAYRIRDCEMGIEAPSCPDGAAKATPAASRAASATLIRSKCPQHGRRCTREHVVTTAVRLIGELDICRLRDPGECDA